MMFFPLLATLLSVTLASSVLRNQQPFALVDPDPSSHANPVSVTLSVMSKCPDALVCENVFDSVLSKVDAKKVDFGLTYLGKEEKNGTLTCKHGEGECQGNIQQLCFRKVHPEIDIWWPFIQCQNYGKKDDIGNWDLAKRCAGVVKQPSDGDFQTCVEGDEGRRLLKESFDLSRHLNIELSCTVQIGGKTVCVHDDGRWKDCDSGHEASDFVNQINEAYDRLNGDK